MIPDPETRASTIVADSVRLQLAGLVAREGVARRAKVGFVGMGQDRFVLELTNEVDDSWAGGQVTVSLPYRRWSASFRTQVSATSWPNQLVLDLPMNVDLVEMRKHRRVPALTDAAPHAAIQYGQVRVAGQVVDISVSGVGIRLAGEPPGLGRGACVDLELQSGTVDLALSAEVARVDGPIVGLMLRPHTVDQASGVKALLQEQLRGWLSARRAARGEGASYRLTS